MNLQQVRASSNGYGRRRHERECSGGAGAKVDQFRPQSGKSSSVKAANAGGTAGGKVGGSSGDRLVYLATFLIGQPVEVQVKNGSLYTGIFHATNADKDFGIILKMAQMTRDGLVKGQKSDGESLSKAPLKTLIIPAKELVQVVAKDVPLTSDGLNEYQTEKQQDLMLDSYISQSHHVDVDRVLEPWVPDEDVPQCPEFDNIFDGHWNRNWDQFETNATLFGVKSTFNEELYTTKLERGPQMKQLEKEASRIAREIEGEVTEDLHLAEERGLHLHEDLDIDEETRFSSVYRGRVADDSGYEEDEDILFNSRNTETFGDSIPPTSTGQFGGLTSGEGSERVPPSSSSLNVEDRQTSSSRDSYSSALSDATRQQSSEVSSGTFASVVTGIRVQESSPGHHATDGNSKVPIVRQQLEENAQLLQSEDNDTWTMNGKKDSPLLHAVAQPPSEVSFRDQEERKPANDIAEGTAYGKRTHTDSPSVESNQWPSSSRSSISDHAGATLASTRTGLTPSSSMGSLSSEKSTLNPNAKEFKLNPNAKSFVPSQTPLRPPSPVSDGSFYVPTNVAAVSHMRGIPVGVGIGPSFVGHQPVMFNQFAPMHPPQGYIHPNAPQYGQQVLYGHTRQVNYMPGYHPDMPYKGRDH